MQWYKSLITSLAAVSLLSCGKLFSPPPSTEPVHQFEPSPQFKPTLVENPVINSPSTKQYDSPVCAEVMQKPLEERIGAVLTGVKERLQQGGMRSFDYSNFVFDQLKEQCILFGDTRVSPSYLEDLEKEISKKLNVHELSGARDNYVTIDAVSLGEDAQKDVMMYNRLKDDFCSYLKQNFAGMTIDSENFKALVGSYVEEVFPRDPCFGSSFEARDSLAKETSTCVRVVPMKEEDFLEPLVRTIRGYK